MKGKAIIPLILGLCVGLVAVKFLVDAVQEAQGSADKQTVSAVRARLDIGSYQKITEEMVELVETTDDTFAPSFQRFSSIEEVVGQVTAKAIPQNAPVLKTMLAPEGTLPGMRGQVKEGYRAVSVRIDEVTGVAYQLQPGDWVDVIVVMDVDTGGGRRRKETIAEVILQRVQIAAIGQATGSAPAQSGGKVKPAKSATLLVLKEDVPKLHLAATRGKLTLAMRGEDDTKKGEPLYATSSEVFGFGGAPKNNPPQQQVVTARPVRRPEPEPKHGVTIFAGSAKGSTQVNQTIFANGNSRVIVGVSQSPINKVGSTTENERNRTRSNRGLQSGGSVQSWNSESNSDIKETN